MSVPAFELPAALEAHEPPEASGLARDSVRLMVASRGEGAIAHARFRDLGAHLRAGDVLVVNTSATLPAALTGARADGARVEVHLSTPAPRDPRPERWVVELRAAGGARPLLDGEPGERVALPGGAAIELLAPMLTGRRLWLARVDATVAVPDLLERHGRPIRYGHVPRPWPLAAYQTIFAREPGSAEMPSAGRPFTPGLVTELASRGVLIAPVMLHAGVSSPERHEAPAPERYAVPAATARLAAAVRGWGGRVVAVGTTVVRALETVTGEDGRPAPGAGWTSAVITPERGVRAVDGLITGWHEPSASHLQMLEAIAGPELLARCYSEALRSGYRWHEFGDSHLLLP